MHTQNGQQACDEAGVGGSARVRTRSTVLALEDSTWLGSGQPGQRLSL